MVQKSSYRVVLFIICRDGVWEEMYTDVFIAVKHHRLDKTRGMIFTTEEADRVGRVNQVTVH